MRTPDNVLYEDEFWVIRNCGPRMWSAHRKSDGEHRLYWSFDSLERDFGRIGGDRTMSELVNAKTRNPEMIGGQS